MQRRRGQSTAEYAIVISVVIAAVIGMQIYIKRGMQAKFKQVTDAYTAVTGNNGINLTGNALGQYEPYYAESNMTVGQNTSASESLAVGGAFSKSNMRETTTRRGTTNQGVNLNAANNWR